MIEAVLIALFAGTVGVTIWGWISISSDARFPVSFGAPPSVSGTFSKHTGLIVYLLVGAFLFVPSLTMEHEGFQLVGAGLLAFFLLIEIYSVRRLIRQRG